MTNKYYIDFCAENNIEYHAVIGYGGFAWLPNNWPKYGTPGTYSDLTKTVPSLDMHQVCDYAASKGLDINVWVHWRALYPQLEGAFAQFELWGVKGMMVDFLDRDDQEMVRVAEEILQRAGKHKLYIQFHGSFKPTGLHCTFPNLFTREGSHNYEHNKWSKKTVSPEHDLNIVFVRMLAGVADYHLGGFRAVPEEEFKTQFTRPLMGGTRCHMLAMNVILEIYLNMVADYPNAYIGQPGFGFIQEVPTIWDRTVVPAAELQKYAVVAREKGNTWYVGGINYSEARHLELKLEFLRQGINYTATIFQDAPDADKYPDRLWNNKKLIRKNDSISVKMAPGGGVAMQLIPE